VENNRLIPLGATASVEVWHDAEAQWLYVRWRGGYDETAAGKGWQFLLQCLNQHPCAKVLNDVRYATSSWAGKEQWAGEALFPLLAQGGVRYVACVYPAALAARFSLDTTLNCAPQPFVAAFEDLASAYAWLQHQNTAAEK